MAKLQKKSSGNRNGLFISSLSFGNKNVFKGLLILLILLIALVVTVILTQKSQDIRQKAASLEAVGYLGDVDCNRIEGWAYAPSIKRPITVSIRAYKFGTNEEQWIDAIADKSRDTSSKAICGFDCGFSITIPNEWKDGKEHPITVDVHDSNLPNTVRLPLAGSTNKIKCMPETKEIPGTVGKVTPSTNQYPVGYLGEVDCNRVEGWGYDPNNPKTAIDVILQADGMAPVTVQANQERDKGSYDACKKNDCGFSYKVPSSWKDGVTRKIMAYGVDENTRTTHPLQVASINTLTCNP